MELGSFHSYTPYFGEMKGDDNMSEEYSIQQKTNSRYPDEVLKELVTSTTQILNTLIPEWSSNPSTRGTPRRFIEYLAEYTQDIPFDRIFGSIYDLPKGASHQIIAQVNIPFRGMCEHHLLPMWGTAALGYIPNAKVLGLSKLVRLVQAVGVEKPSLQEYYADRIVYLMRDRLDPAGIALIIKSEHSCMACRGVATPNVPTITSTMDGAFLANPTARQEFLELVKMGDHHVK